LPKDGLITFKVLLLDSSEQIFKNTDKVLLSKKDFTDPVIETSISDFNEVSFHKPQKIKAIIKGNTKYIKLQFDVDSAPKVHDFLFLDRALLAEAKEDEFYFIDLVGCSVVDSIDEKLAKKFGKVIEVISVGSQHNMVVEKADVDYEIPTSWIEWADTDLKNKIVVVPEVNQLFELTYDQN